MIDEGNRVSNKELDEFIQSGRWERLSDGEPGGTKPCRLLLMRGARRACWLWPLPRSNRRPLQWARFKISASTAFRFHAHPNIEIMLVVDGALWETRWDGPVVDKGPYARGAAAVGPKLTPPHVMNATFTERCFRKGSIIFNEIGSVHRSYCSDEEGCELFGIWGGCHARMDPQNLPDAVRDLDAAARGNRRDEDTATASGKRKKVHTA